MNQIVFPIASALSSLTFSLLFGGTLGSTFEQIHCFTTSSLKFFPRSYHSDLTHGIVFMKIDAVVYAHNCHRHNTEGTVFWRLSRRHTPMRTKPSVSQDAVDGGGPGSLRTLLRRQRGNL